MMPYRDMLDAAATAVLPPAVAAASVFWLVLRAAPKRGEWVAAAVALAAGFVAGNYFRGTALYRLREPWEWLLGIVALALLAGLVTRPGTPPRVVVWASWALFAWVGVSAVVPEGAVWMRAGLASAIFANWIVLDSTSRRFAGRGLPAGLAIVHLSAGLVLALAHSAYLADLALIPGGALVGLAAVARRRSVAGAMPAVAVGLPSLLLLGQQYTFSDVPSAAFLMLGLSPLSLAWLLLPRVNRIRAGWPALVGLLSLLLPAAVAAALAARAESLYTG